MPTYRSRIVFFYFFFLMILRPPRSTLFRYTSLFRSMIWKLGSPGYVGGAWGNPFIVKNHFELKNARRVLFEGNVRSEEHTSELQSLTNLVCRLLLEKKKKEMRHHKRITHLISVRIPY